MNIFTVLHPYYKLAYIKLSWGGEKEQAAEIAAGNPKAKNWHDEARQLVERTVNHMVIVTRDSTNYLINRWLSIITIAPQRLPLSLLRMHPLPRRHQLMFCQNSTSIAKRCFQRIWKKAGPWNYAGTLVRCNETLKKTQILSNGGRYALSAGCIHHLLIRTL